MAAPPVIVGRTAQARDWARQGWGLGAPARAGMKLSHQEVPQAPTHNSFCLAVKCGLLTSQSKDRNDDIGPEVFNPTLKKSLSGYRLDSTLTFGDY